LTGKVLFHPESRRLTLTPDSDLALSYDKSTVRLHDELLSRLSSPVIEGHVSLDPGCILSRQHARRATRRETDMKHPLSPGVAPTIQRPPATSMAR
jgi:hypothetical protein